MRCNMIKLFWEGYNYFPWLPYSCPENLRVRRGIHNALGLHRDAHDGSWVFGYDHVCSCGMPFGKWSEGRCAETAKEWTKKETERMKCESS